jgi:hypothetical protein
MADLLTVDLRAIGVACLRAVKVSQTHVMHALSNKGPRHSVHAIQTMPLRAWTTSVLVHVLLGNHANGAVCRRAL